MIDALVAQVYEAGLSPELWPETVRGVSDALGGAKVGLLHLDRPAMSIEGWSRDLDPATWTGGSPAEYHDPKSNPALRIALALPVGSVIDRRVFIDDAGVDRHPMARNFFEPNRMFHLLFSTVQRDPGSASFLFIARRREQPAFEPGDQSRATLLSEHIGRAMRTYRALGLAEARTLAFAQALERLATGVVLTDANLRVLHANPAGERMFEAGDGVELRLGRLVLADRWAQRRLELAAARLSDAAQRFGDVHLEAWRHGRAAAARHRTSGDRKHRGIGPAGAGPDPDRRPRGPGRSARRGPGRRLRPERGGGPRGGPRGGRGFDAGDRRAPRDLGEHRQDASEDRLPEDRRAQSGRGSCGWRSRRHRSRAAPGWLLQVGEGGLQAADGLLDAGARGGDVEAQEALAAGAEGARRGWRRCGRRARRGR